VAELAVELPTGTPQARYYGLDRGALATAQATGLQDVGGIRSSDGFAASAWSAPGSTKGPVTVSPATA
jgi:hypothetical protein